MPALTMHPLPRRALRQVGEGMHQRNKAMAARGHQFDEEQALRRHDCARYLAVIRRNRNLVDSENRKPFDRCAFVGLGQAVDEADRRKAGSFRDLECLDRKAAIVHQQERSGWHFGVRCDLEFFRCVTAPSALELGKSEVGTMSHSYKLNDSVQHQRQGPQGRSETDAPMIYTVVQRMPIEADGRLRYRIRSKSDNIERVVTEDQLSYCQ